MTQLSTEVFTHKLKIKGDETRYITRKFAENIFNQLNDPETKTVTISNPTTLTYMQKYKADVELSELKGEEKNFEDTLHLAGLTSEQKEQVRIIWNNRKSEGKPQTEGILNNIINSLKGIKI